MSDWEWRLFMLGLCTGATASFLLSMLFWWLGVGT